LNEQKEMKTNNLFLLLFLMLGKMVTGTIIAGCLAYDPGQNKVPVTIFPARFWKHFP